MGLKGAAADSSLSKPIFPQLRTSFFCRLAAVTGQISVTKTLGERKSMDMKKRDFLGLAAGVGAAAGLAAATSAADAQPARPSPAGRPIDVNQRSLVSENVQPSTVDWNYKPRRVNKAIELWEDSQPIYYNGSGLGPGVDPYAQGVKMARTWYDAINVEMEHGALDFSALREFMRGLVDGGPTRSGHRTPAVFVETGIIGLDEPYARANTWVIEQLLDCGIHGIHQCHARDTKAVQTTMQMGCRYPFPRPGIKLPMRGLRGSSASYAALIWGVDTFKYNHIADLWPLNPKGELIYGVKIEDTFADQQVDGTLSLPGLAMAEWGPGDHSYWLYGLDVMPEDGSRPQDIIAMPEMVAVRKKVLDLCKKNNVKFLNAGSTRKDSLDYVIGQIQDGAMVLESDQASSILGREFTKRKMPV
jgi:4-hydroxy-2-oxoheptanedioate aldolase